VDGTSLVGITQDKAAEIMMHTGEKNYKQSVVNSRFKEINKLVEQSFRFDGTSQVVVK
jgi:hypothetical protein